MTQSKPGRPQGGRGGPSETDRASGSDSSSRSRRRPAWKKLALLVVVMLALFLAWRYTPLGDFLTAERLRGWARAIREATWSPIAVIAAYTPAAFLMFPRPLITLVAVIAYGPWVGFALAMCGYIAAAAATYGAGRALPAHALRKVAGEKMERTARALRGHGVLASFAVSIAHAAPVPVIGMVAGAAHIKLWAFLAGNTLAMAPGVLVTVVFAEQIESALDDAANINYWVIAGVAVFFVALLYLLRRWVARIQQRHGI